MQPSVKKVDAPLRPVAGRVPPHNMDAEAAVLSAVFMVPDEFDTVAGVLRSEHFYSDANRRIFEAMVELAGTSQPIDVVTVATRLHAHGRLGQVGGSPYLAMIQDAVPAVVNIASYAEIVRDAWQKRQLIARCQTFAAEAYDTPTPGRELVQNAEASLAELGESGAANAFARIGDIVSAEVVRIDEARRLGVTGSGLSTGFRKVDEVTAGLHKGDLYILAARPGHGKSSLVMNVAAHVARPCQDGVGVFSLEMPKEQIAARLACAERGIDASAVRRNRLNDEQWEEFQRAATDLAQMPLWIDDTAALSLLELRARARKLQRDIAAGRMGVACTRLGLVCVDYLQLMHGIRERGDSREQEIGSISRGLKQLAKDLEIPIIALSQLNRTTENQGDHRPKLSSLRESGNIEQDADSVWFIYRPDMYDKEATPGDAEFIVAKQRNGPLDTIEMHFRGATMRFYERAAGVDVDQFDNFDDALDNT